MAPSIHHLAVSDITDSFLPVYLSLAPCLYIPTHCTALLKVPYPASVMLFAYNLSLWRLRQVDHGLEASLGYTVTPCLRKQVRKCKTTESPLMVPYFLLPQLKLFIGYKKNGQALTLSFCSFIHSFSHLFIQKVLI